LRRLVAGVLAVVTAGTGVALGAALPAAAATVYEIDARWAEGTPTTVASGDVVTAEWRVNVNDDAPAPGNEPVDNVHFEAAIDHGIFRTVPDACLTTGVSPVSSISADGKTLVCNIGTKDQGTSHVVQTAIQADGSTGDQITAVGTIDGHTDDVPPIEIVNPFAMDIAWQTPTNNIGWADNYVDIDVQWTLFTQTGSDPGPDSVSYRLDVTNPLNAEVQVGPQACTPFASGGATGHPWSGGGHPASQTAPFVDSCTLTKNPDGSFTLTLTGIDYSRLQVPTQDSVGRALPANREAVASGTVWFRFMSGANNSMTLTSDAPTYQAPSGATSTDDPSNNQSNKTWTRGGWSNAWQPNASGVQVPSWWSNEFRISPGREVQSVVNATFASSNPAAVFGHCVVMDTRYVDFLWARMAEGWGGGGDVAGATVEYYVGSSALVNPSNNAYDPNAFTCDADPGGWTTTLPADLSTVKAVRATYPYSAISGMATESLLVRQRVKDTAPIGTDVWQWGAAYRNGQWEYPSRSMDEADRTGPATPGKRYPFIGSGRDVLYVIGVTPAVTKSVDRASIKPGIPATYTLTYSANGTGAVDPTVDGFELVDTLPVGMTYVDDSATPEPAVSTNGSGQQVLTWTLDDVPTNSANALTYQAVAAPDVTPGTALTNSVVASVAGETSSPATAQVTVSTNGFTALAKTTDQWFIANPDGDGSGESGSWTVTLKSEDPLPSAFTDTIDILPFNGDGRGTDFEGTYEVTAVDAPAGATVYYTDEPPATLSDDPNAQANGSAGNPSSLWSTTKPANPTAVRVVGGELAPGATFAFTVHIKPDGAQPGDVYVNRAQAIAEHTELVMRTSEPLTMGTRYSVSLKKYVQDADGNWRDANDAAEYPSFREGDTVNYRVVVTNTGQGTLRDLTVSDDKQPQLGSFEIDELAPGEQNAFVHEYEVTLGADVPDSIVNTACVSAPRPADTNEDVDTSCDPAGITVDGEPTHAKELRSATPVGDGRWELVYGIDVENASTHPTSYSLEDDLAFTDQATVVSAAVTESPDGVTLADPAWDGAANPRIATGVPLAGNDDPGYGVHHYELTVVAEVPLQLDGAGSGAGDPTQCGAEDDRSDRAFANHSALRDASGEVETDRACAPIPSIEITKGVSQGPTPNGDGTWTVVYDIVATNDGAEAGVYDVTDRMTADGDLEVVSGRVVTTPEGVAASEDWTGFGPDQTSPENVIATDVTLPAGASHTYQVEVVLGIAAGTEGAPVITPCSALGEGPGGLSNTAQVAHNDLTADDDACVTIAYITVTKTVAEGPTPNGDGTYTVVYDVVAENVGGAAGDYEVTDRLHFGEGIEIDSAKATGPDGVDVRGTWTGRGADGADENVIASGVTLAAGASHTYRVTVVVQLDEATLDPAALACPPPGTGQNGGLANSATLTHNGITASDEVCPSLPLIEFTKTISAGPDPIGEGQWQITYDLIAHNAGQAAGDYDLVDELRYGAGIDIASAKVITAPDGVETNAGWTGRGKNTIDTGVGLAKGATHTYQVQVVVSLDRDVVTPATLACPEPGSGEPGGLANTGVLTHNGEDTDDEVCATLPLIEVTKSLSGAVTPVDGQDGVYDATYQLTVTNRGPGAGVYDLADELAPGEGVEVVGVQDVTTDAPDSVGINPDFDGVDTIRIVSEQPIGAAPQGATVVHTYTVVVRYGLDLSEVDVDPAADACTAPGGGTIPGALDNTAQVGWNGITGQDDECVRPGKPTLDKALVSAEPVGEGRWEVVYDLTVGNVGAEATTYDLDDELLFAPVITAESVDVTGPEGVELNAGFDGDTDRRIATDVTIAGLDDEGYAPHVYRVTVTAGVPLHFDAADVEEDGTGSPACTIPAGGNLTEQGLNNAATLTDETGDTVTDTDCAPVPSFDITKVVDGDPVLKDGAWTVNYAIQVVNDGAAAGAYDLVDRLRYGTGIQVQSATVTEAPKGVMPAESWTGRGEEGDAANVIASDVQLAAGTTHTYRVQVVATVDAAAANASTWACPEPGTGEPGGFANTAGMGHNGLTDTAEACATPDEPEGATPGGTLPKTGVMIGTLVGAAALLLLLGLLAVHAARRRTTS
jgi:uncharacterized repeat protein (TIGR01451 family)